MSDPRDFLISTEPGEHHLLKVSRLHEDHHPLIFISTNHRMIGLSPSMAEELLRGLMAVLKGGFLRAISETALRTELEDSARRSGNVPLGTLRQTPPSAPPIKPELDML